MGPEISLFKNNRCVLTPKQLASPSPPPYGSFPPFSQHYFWCALCHSFIHSDGCGLCGI